MPLDLIQYHPSVVEDRDFETYRYKYANYDNEHNIPIINLEELSSAKRATAKMPALRGPVKAALDAYDIGLMSEYFRNQINK